MGFKEEIKSKFESNQLMAAVNIIYTSNWLRDVSLPIYKKYNILSQHYNILRIVNGSYPDSVSPGYIKEVMLDKGRDLTRLVDKLVNLGYVERNLCKDNRRKMKITITKSGTEIIENIGKEINNLYTSYNLSEQEAIKLSELLDKLRS
ncbi:MAG: MarR family transcriptional regulator [Flavobacteriales bacterium]|nr:MarR family transcriptional regulator [Flavobacteriales bacterium]|tara:strand:- start:5125 stop:5568 length:444 start_codon:yes stop_codon:yes gene_type:complete